MLKKKFFFYTIVPFNLKIFATIKIPSTNNFGTGQ